MTDDYTNARYWAISSIGYGKGYTPGEAHENYVRIQLRSWPAKSTAYGTKPKWEAALRTGDAKATIFHVPEGVTGFVLDGRVRWTKAIGNGATEYIEVGPGERLEDERPEEES